MRGPRRSLRARACGASGAVTATLAVRPSGAYLRAAVFEGPGHSLWQVPGGVNRYGEARVSALSVYGVVVADRRRWLIASGAETIAHARSVRSSDAEVRRYVGTAGEGRGQGDVDADGDGRRRRRVRAGDGRQPAAAPRRRRGPSKTRFKKRIAHGMLSAGFISAVLGTKLAPNSRRGLPRASRCASACRSRSATRSRPRRR